MLLNETRNDLQACVAQLGGRPEDTGFKIWTCSHNNAGALIDFSMFSRLAVKGVVAHSCYSRNACDIEGSCWSGNE